MDVSRQELPLTAYFSRGKKKNKTTPHSSHKRKPEDSGVSPAKRTRAEVQEEAGRIARNGSSQSLRSDSVRRTKAVIRSTHLPTPVTSVRRRGRFTQRPGDTSPEPLANRKAAGTVPLTARKPVMLGEIDLTLSDADDSPSPVPLQAGSSKEIQAVHSPFAAQSLPTPSPGSSVTNAKSKLMSTRPTRASLSSPITTVRKAPLPSLTAARPGDSELEIELPTVPGPSKFPVSFTKATSSRPTTRGDSTMLYGYEDDNPFVSVPPKRCVISNTGLRDPHTTLLEPTTTVTASSEETEETTVNTRALLVTSSQSQYLLPMEATPKRNRTRYDDIVLGSQTQEETELFMGMSASHILQSSMGRSVGILPLKCGESEVIHPSPPSVPRDLVTSADASSEPSSTPKQVLDKPPTRPRHASQHQPRAHSYSHSSRTISREDSMDVPPDLGDDSVTEPESDTEMTRWLAQLESKRKDRVLALSSPHRATPRPVFSPLVSPVRQREEGTPLPSPSPLCRRKSGQPVPSQLSSPSSPRGPARPVPSATSHILTVRRLCSAEPSVSASLELLMQEGAGPRVPGSSSLDHIRLGSRSESLPSIVRDFMDMFKGDGSYPDDFPESLRI